MHGFIDIDEKVAYSKQKSRIHNKSAKTMPYLKPKSPKSILYIWPKQLKKTYPLGPGRTY